MVERNGSRPVRVRQMKVLDVGDPPECAFHAFHDESGTYAGKAGERWLLHGVLLVEAERLHQAFGCLQAVREAVDYPDEVHFTDLRNAGASRRYLCATKWLETYILNLSGFCYYYCLAVDTHSPAFDHSRFGKPHHVYNRFALMAVESAIAWSLKGRPRVALKVHSDAKFRLAGDNFQNYLPRELVDHLRLKHDERPESYPELRLAYPEVVPVISDPHKETLGEECELIQLVDLLTGAVRQAVTAGSDRSPKVTVGKIVGQWIADTSKPPWMQTKELHRRFRVTSFPDEKGQFTNPSAPGVVKGSKTLFNLS